MTGSFNGLTPAEAERLDLMQEECAEVIMAIAKIKRHGLESYHPDDPAKVTNREALATEFGHVLNAFNLMRKAGDISYVWVLHSQEDKAKTIGKYLHHQPGYEGYCGS